jgi:hypothetical protein
MVWRRSKRDRAALHTVTLGSSFLALRSINPRRVTLRDRERNPLGNSLPPFSQFIATRLLFLLFGLGKSDFHCSSPSSFMDISSNREGWRRRVVRCRGKVRNGVSIFTRPAQGESVAFPPQLTSDAYISFKTYGRFQWPRSPPGASSVTSSSPPTPLVMRRGTTTLTA